MATLLDSSTGVGNSLKTLLGADDIVPGAEPSYQLCKTIYQYHPLGAKMVDAPIALAQSQSRLVAIPDSPEERVRDAFAQQWKRDGVDRHIFNVMSLARTYGIASIGLLIEGIPEDRPLSPEGLWDSKISFNVFDPLNTSGSLVLNQNPNAMDFQKVRTISVAGKTFHRSRACVMMNENPIYIAYVQSAFGYTGRSVYQRALFPLKSFVNTMQTDDMVSRKAGVLIAKLRPAGSIVNQLMQRMAGLKRALLKEAENDNVISVEAPDESVESLNLQNVDGAASMARGNILKNIATAADMPAVLLENETLTEGFGEGTEDAKMIAKYINRFRNSMAPIYSWFDTITMHRAWNPEFYKAIQSEFPEQYGRVPHTAAVQRWKNSFTAEWPSLLEEPPSEEIKVDDAKLKAIIAMLEVLLPQCDPGNKATLVQWAQDNFNELKLLFPNPLELDVEALAEFDPTPQMLGEEPGAPKPFSDGKHRRAYTESMSGLIAGMVERERPRKVTNLLT